MENGHELSKPHTIKKLRKGLPLRKLFALITLVMPPVEKIFRLSAFPPFRLSAFPPFRTPALLHDSRSLALVVSRTAVVQRTTRAFTQSWSEPTRIIPNQEPHQMKPIITKIALPVLCLTVALLSTGCVGMMVRSAMTETATYQDITAKVPIPPGKARVWVYVLGGGPNAWNTIGLNGFMTFHKEVYQFGGNAFIQLDLPPGETRVTTTDVQTTTLFSYHFNPGKIRKQITLESGKEYFIKIQWRPTEARSLSEPVEFANEPSVLRQNEFKSFVMLSAL